MTAGDLLAVLSGGLVGFALGLIGGGGSILAVPLLIYVVGVADPHVAIGTSALAVSANAFANLIQHARVGTVKWPCAATFAASGVVGALAGSTLGKLMDGQKLLALFALAMVAVGISMLRGRAGEGDPGVRLDLKMAPRLVGGGLAVGFLSGFFGIGGGFLIVPALLLGSGMPILNAVGSSLFSVGALASPPRPTTPPRAWWTGASRRSSCSAAWRADGSGCGSRSGWRASAGRCRACSPSCSSRWRPTCSTAAPGICSPSWSVFRPSSIAPRSAHPGGIGRRLV